MNSIKPPHPDCDTIVPQRCVRHVTSIQVRNLTPFPVRDAFASALSKPSEQPQFTTSGHFFDDIDVSLSRKRGRRISSNSLTTQRSRWSDDTVGDDILLGMAESRGRRASKLSLNAAGGQVITGSPTSVTPARPVSGTAATTLIKRTRTNSTASVHYKLALRAPSLGLPSDSAGVPSSAILFDNSQIELEKVMKSRLVETFLAIIVASPYTAEDLQPSSAASEATNSRPPTPRQREKQPALHSKLASTSTLSRKLSKASGLDNSKSPPLNRRRESLESWGGPSGKTAVAMAKRPPTATTAPDRKSSPSSSSLRKANRSSSASTRPKSPPLSSIVVPPCPIPNYLSPVHRPSTNPSFIIDPRSGNEFADWTDLSANSLKVDVWGRVSGQEPNTAKRNIKGKEKEGNILSDSASEGSEWKILAEWDFKLTDLVPLPDDLASHAEQLPSNTLFLTLSPPGKTFYLPQGLKQGTRPSSPSPGYSSDPEYCTNRNRVDLDVPVELEVEPRIRKRRGGIVSPDTAGGVSKSATWQDLLKLVNLQACIQENQKSLESVVSEIGALIEQDAVSPLKRQVSEREAHLDDMLSEIRKLESKTRELTKELRDRRDNIEERRDMLAEERLHLQDAKSREVERGVSVTEARNCLLSLEARFTPVRTTLLSTLAAIYPIDVLSPPDLLFTILSVPLPIPILPSDPAPPLTLSEHTSVTEEAVATALGYVAQVIQLLAAYMGRCLVYPVTCVGSRSFIRDPISAMVGPRMFPLYSRGVDTYRFEYGVFLLNKDIEMLMAERDLRSMDVRHTLPNLKNLLLTLTDGEGARLSERRSINSNNNNNNSPTNSISGLVSPPRAQSPPAIQVTPGSPKSTPEESHIVNDIPPTTETSDAPLRKSFLGLSSLGFLLMRHSASPDQPGAESPEGRSGNGEVFHSLPEASWASEDQLRELDDEDRKTIRPEANGPAHVGGESTTDALDEEAIEKLSENVLSLPAVQPSIVPGIS